MVKGSKGETTVQSQKYHQFFKVYLPQHSSERMLIPSAFIARLNKIVPEKTILRNCHGRIWNVDLVETEDGVFFHNGWQSFLGDNFVELGDFFHFRYDGDHMFDVKLLGKAGCEKKETDHIDPYIKEEEEEDKVKEEKKEKEEEGDDDDDDDDNDNDIDNENSKDIDNDDDDYDNDDDDDHDDDDDDDDDDNENDDDDDDYDEEDYEKKEDEKPKAKNFNLKMQGCKTKSHSGVGKKIVADSNCRHKGTTAVKVEGAYDETAAVKVEKDIAITAENYVQPKNPYFVAKFRPGKRNKLHVPADVLKDHNLQLHPKMILCSADGKKWVGKVAIWQDGRTWIGGWKAFCRWNNVGKNDLCICEFVSGRGQRGNLIQVHIVRGGLLTDHT
ncbi:hypothetical protein L1049_015494 [Liquidambar formosana]|uniref:TF-B3 domain-containing protein n=1 Tax=Liquidambar formosana TaxID=63359 RepID=A0AAP0RYY9_LIQFO